MSKHDYWSPHTCLKEQRDAERFGPDNTRSKPIESHAKVSITEFDKITASIYWSHLNEAQRLMVPLLYKTYNEFVSYLVPMLGIEKLKEIEDASIPQR